MARVLTGADIVSYGSGNVIRFRVAGEGDGGEPELRFYGGDAPWILVDFPEAGLVSGRARHISNTGGGVVRGVDLVSSGGRVRASVRLIRHESHDFHREGGVYYLVVNAELKPGESLSGLFPGDVSGSPGVVAGASGVVSSVSDVDVSGGGGLEAAVEGLPPSAVPGSGDGVLSLVDFSLVDGESGGADLHLRVEGEAGLEYETLPDGSVDLFLSGVVAPERLAKRYDTRDFAAPVPGFEIMNERGGVRVLVRTSGANVESVVWQADGDIHVLVSRKVAGDGDGGDSEGEVRRYTGDPVSLDFQKIELRPVLQLLGQIGGKNVVITDSVHGDITIRLRSLPWDQALDIILKSKGLGKREEGNVLYIAPLTELSRQDEQRLENRRKREGLEPLVFRRIQINYARAEDIAGVLRGAGGDEGDGLVSGRGKITVDARTNSLLVLETSSRIGRMVDLIRELDIPVRQVMIDSRIVLAKKTFSRDLGVKFGYSRHSGRNTQSAGGLFYEFGGKHAGDVDYGSGTAFTTNNLENYIVNLPVAGVSPAASLGLAIGKIGSYLLQMELSAAEAEGMTEVVSNPKVITADRKEAVIEQGTEIPYQEASSSGATSVSFKKAVLSLKVTPQITPDGNIIMDLDISKDKVGEVFNGVPSIDTQKISTQVLVRDGETVVLGGVYTRNRENRIERVPFFGDLPGVGRFFRRTSRGDDKDELLIFVTPRVIRQELGDWGGVSGGVVRGWSRWPGP